MIYMPAYGEGFQGVTFKEWAWLRFQPPRYLLATRGQACVFPFEPGMKLPFYQAQRFILTLLAFGSKM